MMFSSERTENVGAKVVPLYAARIEDLGPGDFVKVDCAACEHTALLASAFLDWLGLGHVAGESICEGAFDLGDAGGLLSFYLRPDFAILLAGDRLTAIWTLRFVGTKASGSHLWSPVCGAGFRERAKNAPREQRRSNAPGD
jgi:hypothetical protein